MKITALTTPRPFGSFSLDCVCDKVRVCDTERETESTVRK